MARKKIPAVFLRRARERGEVVGNTQLVWTPSDVEALIERVNARYRGLALLVAQTPVIDPEDPSYVDPLGAEWRAAWAGQYASWLNFAENASTFWGSSAASAQAFDQELDEWRSVWEERTGQESGLPTSTTAEQGREWEGPGFFSGVGLGAGGTLAVGLVGLGLFVWATKR